MEKKRVENTLKSMYTVVVTNERMKLPRNIGWHYFATMIYLSKIHTEMN